MRAAPGPTAMLVPLLVFNEYPLRHADIAAGAVFCLLVRSLFSACK
jgi:hypothetical protein